MTLTGRITAAAALTALVALIVAASAVAAPPANDDRATPTALGALPAQVMGTTAGATRAPTDPASSCATAGPQVWYRFTAPTDGRIAVRLAAEGDLDAVLDAYLSERSQTTSLSCDVTDAQGLGAVDFRVQKGQAYLIAVSMLPNSVAGDFQLTVVAPQPPAQPPGLALPAGGVSGTLDRVGNTEDAYAVRMRAGQTYRFRLSSPDQVEEDQLGCGITVRIFEPGTRSFDARPVKRFGCNSDGYATFTPGPGKGGRYSVLVSAAPRTRTLQRYHLESAGAGGDDLAPGLFVGNHRTVAGTLNGARVDALDLYRFSVARRSDLTLKLQTTGNRFDMVLLNDRGRIVQCQCGSSGPLELTRELNGGRYFVAIRARDASAGAYRLSRTSKVLTRTTVGFHSKRATLGATLAAGVRVRPAVGGPFTVVIQRFDPLSGWLFYRQDHGRASAGHGSIAFTPPAIGRWRVRATYDGTLGAGASESGFAEVLVVGSGPS